jgi:hypothetical protein
MRVVASARCVAITLESNPDRSTNSVNRLQGFTSLEGYVDSRYLAHASLVGAAQCHGRTPMMPSSS